MIILSFDPGGTTGWASLNTNNGDIDSGAFPDWHGIVEVFDKVKPDVVVYEIFRLYAWKAQHKAWDTFPEIEAVGVIKFICESRGISYYGQNPAERKFFTDEKLKAWGICPKSPHSRDAIRHALYFAKFNKNK